MNLRWMAFTGLIGLVVISPAVAQTPPAQTERALLAAGHKPMTGSQIATALTGNTAYVMFLARIGPAVPGNTVRILYRDARVRISVTSEGANAGKKIESNWWIEGDHVCAEQRLINIGHTCSSLIEVKSLGIYSCLRPGGECNFLLRIAPGNPDNI